MTAITDTPSPIAAPFARAAGAFAAVVARRTKQLVRAIKHRGDVAILASFDDRMLADIGLTRGDLRDAFSLPLWEDPTPILMSRAGDHRAARQRRAPATSPTVVSAPSIVPHVNAATCAPRAQAS